jgi:hypothetical protein
MKNKFGLIPLVIYKTGFSQNRNFRVIDIIQKSGDQLIFVLPELISTRVVRSNGYNTGGIAEEQLVNTIPIILNRLIYAIDYKR